MWNTIIIGAGTAICRNVGQWAKYALVDKKVDDYEWKQLAITSVVSLVVYFTAYFPSVMMNLGNEEVISTMVTILLAPMFEKLVAKWNEKKK